MYFCICICISCICRLFCTRRGKRERVWPGRRRATWLPSSPHPDTVSPSRISYLLYLYFAFAVFAPWCLVYLVFGFAHLVFGRLTWLPFLCFSASQAASQHLDSDPFPIPNSRSLSWFIFLELTPDIFSLSDGHKSWTQCLPLLLLSATCKIWESLELPKKSRNRGMAHARNDAVCTTMEEKQNDRRSHIFPIFCRIKIETLRPDPTGVSMRDEVTETIGRCTPSPRWGETFVVSASVSSANPSMSLWCRCSRRC